MARRCMATPDELVIDYAMRLKMSLPIELRRPDRSLLDAYTAALEAGWSPNSTRDVCAEQLAAIRADAQAFLAEFEEREGRTVTLPGGQVVARLPGPVFWIVDDAFCGAINLRYLPGTLDLPPHVSGHIGFSVVPWKRRQGVASAALRLLLPIAKARGLERALITCDEDNVGSRRVIEGAGGLYAGSAPSIDHVAKRLYWLITG